MPAPSLARIIYTPLGRQSVAQVLGNVVNQTKVIYNNFPFSRDPCGDSVEGTSIKAKDSIQELAWLLCS
jgi:hypothetical protein